MMYPSLAKCGMLFDVLITNVLSQHMIAYLDPFKRALKVHIREVGRNATRIFLLYLKIFSLIKSTIKTLCVIIIEVRYCLLKILTFCFRIE